MSKKEVKALKDELKALQQSSDEELKELKLEVKKLSKVNEKQRLELKALEGEDADQAGKIYKSNTKLSIRLNGRRPTLSEVDKYETLVEARINALQLDLDDQHKLTSSAVAEVRGKMFENEAKHMVKVMGLTRDVGAKRKEVEKLQAALDAMAKDLDFFENKSAAESAEVRRLMDNERKLLQDLEKHEKSNEEKLRLRQARELEASRAHLAETVERKTAYASVLRLVATHCFVSKWLTRKATEKNLVVAERLIDELIEAEGLGNDGSSNSFGQSALVVAEKACKGVRQKTVARKDLRATTKCFAVVMSQLNVRIESVLALLRRTVFNCEQLSQRNVELAGEKAESLEQLAREKSNAASNAVASSENWENLKSLMTKHETLDSVFKATTAEMTRKLKHKERALFKKSVEKRELQSHSLPLPFLDAGMDLVSHSSMFEGADVTTILTTIYCKNAGSSFTPGGAAPAMGRVDGRDNTPPARAVESMEKVRRRNKAILHKLSELHSTQEALLAHELPSLWAQTHVRHSQGMGVVAGNGGLRPQTSALERSMGSGRPYSVPRVMRPCHPADKVYSLPVNPNARPSKRVGRYLGPPRSSPACSMSLEALESQLLKTLKPTQLEGRNLMPLPGSMSAPPLSGSRSVPMLGLSRKTRKVLT